ncbi:response regulator receiver protein [Solidesulfovibrio fructosivorans JJ]]|uniref:Response regulator receiver protein n=1 Tax=Solidesulfovibrio fructosivorans JJ] TaxID=596151 RepID=E1JT77_SOLFR|nr:response regulator [Solidesulfovibrio fructosivorans]EFL52337.1 response regulator receiver protein [Solidesulfovibrio fructosivorans JJ]]
MIKLFWLDDQINELEVLRQLLIENDFEIDICKTTESALRQIKSKDYDIILVDLRLPGSDKNGIDFIIESYKIRPNCKYAVLSSFLYRAMFIDGLRNLHGNPPVLEIDKCFGIYGSNSFYEKFLQKLIDLYSYDTGEVIKKYSSGLDVNSIDPFEITLDQYESMSSRERDTLFRQAFTKAKDLLDRAWAMGYEWVMICKCMDLDYGATEYNLKLTEDEILNISKDRNAVPFEFYKPIESADVSWTGCGKNENTHWYPTVTFKVNGRKGNPNFLNIHFDTGTFESVVSYEIFREIGIISQDLQPKISQRKETGEFLLVYLLHPKLHLFGQRTEQTALVQLLGFAIKDWEQTSWAKFCTDKCDEYLTKVGKRLCPERIGLIGRSLITENKVTLILNGRDKFTDFVTEKSKNRGKK